MKYLFLLLGLLCIQWSPVASCSNWKKRMEKYGALTNCQYYVTSENEYKDSFEFDEVAKKTDNNTLQLQFFVIAQNEIKFQLSENDVSSPPPALPLPAPLNDMYGYDDNTESTPALSPYWRSSIYEIVIGQETQEDVYRDGRTITESYSESYVSKDGARIKSLTTPGIIRSNEPNEILVEIFADGKLRTTINENTVLEIKSFGLDDLKYISFLSPNKRVLREFFYKCD